MIAGFAVAAVPRSFVSAATMAAADSTADSTVTAPLGPPMPAGRDSAAAAVDTSAAGAFAAEPPETLRFIQPADVPTATETPAAPETPAPSAAEPPKPATPDQPYGPLPKGVTSPGGPPPERGGLWGLHPAAIVAGLIVLHVLVVRAVTK